MAKPKNPKKGNGDISSTPVEAVSTAAESNDIETTAKRSVKKPTIVRSEPRANLVPINLEDEIRRLAYLLSERRGFEPGHETDDWLIAEHEVRQRYQQHSA